MASLQVNWSDPRWSSLCGAGHPGEEHEYQGGEQQEVPARKLQSTAGNYIDIIPADGNTNLTILQ